MRRNKLLRSLSFRLALLYAAMLTASVLILFGVTYWFARDYAARDENNEIDVEYASILDEAGTNGIERLPSIIESHQRLRKDVRGVYLLQDAAGKKITGNIPAMAPVLGPTTLARPIDGQLLQIRAHGYKLQNGDYFLVGQDTATLREMNALILRTFAVEIVITLLLAGVGTAIVGTTVLKRVDIVNRTARAIMAGELSQRVPMRGTQDEFDELAEAMNAMLDRIEDLMRSMRQVSNDIAHDLRTPLTRLRQRLELATRHDRSVTELHEVLAHSIQQIDSILETFGALLRIAQVEAGGRISGKRVIDLSALLSGIVEDFSPAAEDRGLQLDANVGRNLRVSADPELLTQMVVNLVDNAIRYCPPGSHIRVQANAVADHLEIAVCDTGPGIPAQERENVLRPFYRLESSRTTEGSGLGLSLVAAIAKRHEAKLSLADNGPGLRVSVLFPMAA